jgi:hypothetical protein
VAGYLKDIMKDIMKDKHYTRCTPYTTKTGLQIGIAYTPPAQQLTYEGEEIQSIMLGYRTPVMQRKGLMIYAVVVAAVFCILAVTL